MAWLTTLPTGVVVNEGSYYERREKPDEPEKTQVRKHNTKTVEYRGMTESSARAANTSTISSLKTTTRNMSAIGGGGYTITEEIDEIIGGWATLA